MGSRTIQLREYVKTDQAMKVDSEKGIVYGVKVIGPESENKRRYSGDVRAKAHKLYEGAKVNIDHRLTPTSPRQLVEGYGSLVNLREASDGTYADMKYNPKHPLAEMITWWALNDPGQLGLSHDAEGKGRDKNGWYEVEEITRVKSVDLVRDPASVRGLNESKEYTMKTTPKTLLETAFATDTTKLAILREMDDVPGMPDEMDQPDESASSDDQVASAFEAMICGVFRDSKLDLKGKLAKIKDIMGAHDKLTSKPEAKSETKDEKTEEGKKPAVDPDAKQLREEMSIRDLIEDAGIKFSSSAARKAFVKSMVPLEESERTAMIDERKSLVESKQNTDSGVRSGTVPLREAKTEAPKFATPKDRVAFLRSR